VLLRGSPIPTRVALPSVQQAGYLIAVQRTGVEKGLDSQDLLLYNALLSVPPLFVVVLLDGELALAIRKLRDGSTRVDFTVLLLASLGAGMLLNYSIFLCTKSNSALTTTGSQHARLRDGHIIGVLS
jgi:solute carrier family 35 protein